MVYIITDVFAHHVSYGSFFFIIPFFSTSIHYIISHYHKWLSGHSVSNSFVLLVSSDLCVAVRHNSWPFLLCLISLVSIFNLPFTVSCVDAWLSCILVLDFLSLLNKFYGSLHLIIQCLFWSWYSQRYLWSWYCCLVCFTRLSRFVITCQLALW